MKKTLRVTVVGVLVCLFAPAARAGGLTIALLPPSGDNVAPAILQASRELLKDHLLRVPLQVESHADAAQAQPAAAKPVVN